MRHSKEYQRWWTKRITPVYCLPKLPDTKGCDYIMQRNCLRGRRQYEQWRKAWATDFVRMMNDATGYFRPWKQKF